MVNLNYKNIKSFLGKEIINLSFLSIVLAIAIFLAESSFIFILQAFLISIKIIPKEQAQIPSWIPTSLTATMTMLVLFGFFKSFVYICHDFIKSLIILRHNTRIRKFIIHKNMTMFSTGSIENTLASFNDLTMRSGFAISALLQFATCTLLIFFYFFSGLVIAWKEMILSSFLMFIAAILIKLINHSLDNSSERSIEIWTDINKSLLQGLKNTFFLNIYNKIDSQIEKTNKSLDKYLIEYRVHEFSMALKSNIPPFVGVVVIAIVTIVSSKYFNSPSPKLLPFFYLFIRMSQSISLGVSQLTNGKFHFSATKKLYSEWLIFQDFNTKKDKTFQEKELNLTIEKDLQLKLHYVSFKYPEKNEFLFKDLSLTLNQGETLFIHGKSGSGKSTLLALILGIIRPINGNISINGFTTYEYKNGLSKLVGYSSMEPFWFSGTLKEILLFGHSDPEQISDYEILNALETANCIDFVNNLEKGIYNFMHEHAQISTGQKQRLSIARMLLRSPRIILLDEATSNLDYTNEKDIISKIKLKHQNSIIIMISHRTEISTFADKIIDFDKIN